MTICCMFVHASLYKRREENQLDATECFIALIICSTCFGHLYAHYQELETLLVLLLIICSTCFGHSYAHHEELGTILVLLLIICSTCFGHSYAHHQELETILVFLPHIVCNALVAGGRRSGAGQQAMRPG